MTEPWWRNDRFMGYGTLLLALIFVVSAAQSLLAPTNWLLVITQTLLAIFLAGDGYLRLSGRRARMDPALVDPAEIDRALAAGDSDVVAVKALRETYRSLALADALRLVRERRGD